MYNLLTQTDFSVYKIANLAEVKVDFVIYLKENITKGCRHPDLWTEKEWKDNFMTWRPLND